MKLLLTLLFFLGSAQAQELNILKLKNKNGFQKIRFNSQPDTTEFLIVSTSHGNPGDVRKKPTVVKGGGWLQISDAGNDDKAVEVFIRTGGSNAGRIDIKGGKGDLSILVFDPPLAIGRVIDKKLLEKAPIRIKCNEPPCLVIAVSDNGKDSNLADFQYGVKKDDQTFIYLTDRKRLLDKTNSGIRGAITSIEIECRQPQDFLRFCL